MTELTKEQLQAHIAAATEKLAQGGDEVVAELLQIYRMALSWLDVLTSRAHSVRVPAPSHT